MCVLCECECGREGGVVPFISRVYKLSVRGNLVPQELSLIISKIEVEAEAQTLQTHCCHELCLHKAF